MASKNDHKGEEPVGWVTVKGKHFPKWKDGTIGWQNGTEDTVGSKSNSTKSVNTSKKPNLEDIQSYGFDSRDVTGDPTIVKLDDGDYYKTGENKWNKHSSSGRVLSGSISDKQMSDKVANSKNVEVLPSAKTNAKTSKNAKSVHTTEPKSADKLRRDLGNMLLPPTGYDRSATKKTISKNASTFEYEGKILSLKNGETHAQAIYRHAQEEAGKSIDKKFYNSLASGAKSLTITSTKSKNSKYDTSRSIKKKKK